MLRKSQIALHCTSKIPQNQIKHACKNSDSIKIHGIESSAAIDLCLLCVKIHGIESSAAIDSCVVLCCGGGHCSKSMMICGCEEW